MYSKTRGRVIFFIQSYSEIHVVVRRTVLFSVDRVEIVCKSIFTLRVKHLKIVSCHWFLQLTVISRNGWIKERFFINNRSKL